MPIIDYIKSDFAEEIVGEKICNNRRICDCVIFTIEDEYVVIGIIELKSKTAHSSEIEEKLTNGLEIASDILEQHNTERLKSEF